MNVPELSCVAAAVTESDDSDENYNPKKRPNTAMKKTVVKMGLTQLKRTPSEGGDNIKIGKKKQYSSWDTITYKYYT